MQPNFVELYCTIYSMILKLLYTFLEKYTFLITSASPFSDVAKLENERFKHLMHFLRRILRR